MKRVALYVRVSHEEQVKHGLSVDNQIAALREYCKEHDLLEVGLYSDAGISARKSYKKRPALLQLIEDCKAGKVDLILFTRLDRWFRSVGDYYEVQNQLEQTRVHWRAIWEDYETETSSGVFKVNIMLSVAQSEADKTSERIKSVLEYKKANGDYLGHIPFGYVLKDGKLIKNPEQERGVMAIFNTFDATRSPARCMEAITNAGYNVSLNLVKKVLTSPIYYGDAYGSKSEPYITKDHHDQIQAFRKQRVRKAKRSYCFLFAGLCKCPYCGGTMRSIKSVPPQYPNKLYKNYYCNGYEHLEKHDIRISVSEKKIEQYLIDSLFDLVTAYNYEVDMMKQDDDFEQVEKQRKRLEQRLERIGIRFEMGDFSVEEYKEKREAIYAEIASLPSPLKKKYIDISEDWHLAYQQLDEAHKKAFWLKTIKQMTIYKGMEQPPKIEFL